MGSLDFSLPIFAAGSHLRTVDEGSLVEIEASRTQSEGIPPKFLILETLLRHGGEASRMDVFGLDGGDVSCVARNDSVLGVG